MTAKTKTAKPKKQRSGGAGLIAAGKKPLLLGLTPEQHELIRQAAELDGRYMTQFVLHNTLIAAKTILEKKQK